MGYQILVFSIGSVLGFGAYAAAGWGSYPARRIGDILTPRRALMIVAAAICALAAAAFMISVAALPGEFFYSAKLVSRAFVGPAFLGIVFGFGAGVWISYFLVPNALSVQHTRTVHRRWGFALLVVFLTGVFYGPAHQLLSQVRGISTSVVTLDFGSRTEVGDPPEDVPPPTDGSGGGDGDGLSKAYLHSASRFIDRDNSYARLLHGEPSVNLVGLEDKAKSVVPLIAWCFAHVVEKHGDDSGSVHAELGRALAAGNAWLRSVMDDERDDRKYWTEFITTYSRLSDCRALRRVGPPNPQCCSPLRSALMHELPYFALTVAHAMQLAGHPKEGAELLAQWIDRSLQRNEEGWRIVPDWYRIRAYIHLSVLVEEGVDRLSTHDVLQRGVQLLENTLNSNTVGELRHYDRWLERCARLPGLVWPRCPECSLDKEELGNITTINFTLMSLRDRQIRHALYTGEVTAALLSHAENNTAVPETCYPDLRDNGRARASFLTTHGGLLVALAKRSFFIVPEGAKDATAYRDAREYLLQALTLLRPLEEEERTMHLITGTVADALEPSAIRQEVLETQTYLYAAERALGMR